MRAAFSTHRRRKKPLARSRRFHRPASTRSHWSVASQRAITSKNSEPPARISRPDREPRLQYREIEFRTRPAKNATLDSWCAVTGGRGGLLAGAQPTQPTQTRAQKGDRRQRSKEESTIAPRKRERPGQSDRGASDFEIEGPAEAAAIALRRRARTIKTVSAPIPARTSVDCSGTARPKCQVLVDSTLTSSLRVLTVRS
jgi:hypothetical protein